MRFNLKDLLPLFEEVGNHKYGGTLDFSSLERIMEPIRKGKEEFSLKHIKAVEKDFDFLKWWKMPEVSGEELKKLKGIFFDLKAKDIEVIEKLFEIFKNIEIVSVFLRLINPYSYGILSAPVENILNVRGPSQVTRYLNYLDNLTELKEEYGFERIADVDMALWALACILNERWLKSKYTEIVESFSLEINRVKKIAIRNALLEIEREELRYLEMAELFLEIDVEIAGFLAGKKLELLVNELCKAWGIKTYVKTNKGTKYIKIPALLEKLNIKKAINSMDYRSLKEWWKLRNEIVHKELPMVGEAEIKELVKRVEEMIKGLRTLDEKLT